MAVGSLFVCLPLCGEAAARGARGVRRRSRASRADEKKNKTKPDLAGVENPRPVVRVIREGDEAIQLGWEG